MRILQVSPSYAPCLGGAERLLQAVSERLVTRGHDVTVLTFDCASHRDFNSDTGSGLPPRETINGVTVIRVKPVAPRLNALQYWILALPGGWKAYTRFAGRDTGYVLSFPNGTNTLLPLLRLRAEVLASVNWGFSPAFWTCLANRVRRLPHVAVPIVHMEAAWSKRDVYPRLMKACDGAIVLTEAEAAFVTGWGARDVAVSGAGIAPDVFTSRDGEAIRAAHNIGDRRVVGFVGRQDVLKGAPTLIESMRVVWRTIPDAVLLMAGPGSSRDAAVTEALAALLPAERANVVLIDDFSDKDAPSIMDACDLLALPSTEEAFGMVMLEAWICGKPVIGANIASTRCIIEDGVDGLLMTPGDANDLAAGILRLLQDKELRDALGRRGREKTLARFSWENVTDVWEKAYQSAITHHRGG